MQRRTLLRGAGSIALGSLAAPLLASELDAQQGVPDAVQRLRPMSPPPMPISDAERLGRIEKARRLMRDNNLGAIVLEPGTSMS